MRKSKIIKIEEVGEVTVKEVSPMAVYKALATDERMESMLALADECISLDREKLLALYPSELEQLVDCFLEVNSSFFAIADKLKLAGMLRAVGSELAESLPPLFVGLFQEGMQTPGITAGSSS